MIKLTITTNNLIAYKAQISKQLMIMRFAIGETTLLVMSMTQKRFLTFRANEVLKEMFILIHLFAARVTRVEALTSTCQCFPNAVTTLSSIGRRHAPHIGIPILSWHRKQYNSFISFAAKPGRLLTSRAVESNSTLHEVQLK